MNPAESEHVPAWVPVFPLPQVVLFPGAILPLHIFEERYREMVADALASEPVIATGLLKSGFEPDYYTRRAPIHLTLGVGRIVACEQVQGGNYNLLLRGMARARILEESQEHAYRCARVQVVESYVSAGEERNVALQRELREAVRNCRGLNDELRSQWRKLLVQQLDLSTLSDLIATGLPAEPELRQLLLDEPDAAVRTELLIEQLKVLSAIQEAQRRRDEAGGINLN